MTTRIYSYNPHSESAKALSDALGIKRIKHEGSRYRPKQDDIVINWGSSNLPDNLINLRIINDPDTISVATNKLSFFELFRDNDQELVVPFTTSNNEVREWLANGKTVVARTKLTGHSGEGIIILEGADAEIPVAPLYTLYIPKKEEYRVHCYRPRGIDNEAVVFDIQRKARKNNVPDEAVDWRVRNLNGGFIYARENFLVPDCVKETALAVFNETGLDFGAVDIIYNDKKNRAFALEINTAPGLSGTTLDNYVAMFRSLIG